MRISVRSIQGKTGASVRSQFESTELGSDLMGADARPLQPLRIEATVTNTGNAYLVEGQVRGSLQLRCGRCLVAYDRPLDVRFTEVCSSTDGNVDDAATDAMGDDNGVRCVEDDVIDISGALREQILLDLPMKSLCRPDCRGLCPVCGTNRNERACECRVESTDPRLAGLAEWSRDGD